MQFKNIKIQVWTDVYYAKFIAIWRPEEEPDYVAPDPDTRTEQEKNVPVLLVQNCVYEAKNQMVGCDCRCKPMKKFPKSIPIGA